MMKRIGDTVNKQVQSTKLLCILRLPLQHWAKDKKHNKQKVPRAQKDQTNESIKHRKRGKQKTHQKPLKQSTFKKTDQFAGKRAQIHPLSCDKTNTNEVPNPEQL